MSSKQLETLLEILNFSAELLKSKGIDDARLNSELMLAEVLKCDRMRLYMDFEKPLTSEEKDQFKILLKRRLNREPLQYILGKTNFYGYDLIVKPGVLIPRPETELLVERMLNNITAPGKETVNIFEAGSGSGCISIAAAMELKKRNISFKIRSIDISVEALLIAQQNLLMNGLEKDDISFMKGDLLVMDRLNEDTDHFICNPPYIAKDQFEQLEPEVNKFEPAGALTDGKDGLSFYRKIIDLIADPDNRPKTYCEIAFDQKEKLENLLIEKNVTGYSFHKDHSGNYRILEII